MSNNDSCLLRTAFEEKLSDYNFKWVIIEHVNFEHNVQNSVTIDNPIIDLVCDGISYVRIMPICEYGMFHIQGNITDKIYQRMYSASIFLYNGEGKYIRTEENIIKGTTLEFTMKEVEKHIMKRYYGYETFVKEIISIQTSNI